MKYFPVFLDLRGKTCLVAGGGSVAERKIRALLDAGARVLCLSERFTPGLRYLSRAKNLILRNRKIATDLIPKALLKNIFLAIGATSSPAVNAGLFEACRKRNVLVNAVDDAGHSNFITASVLDRGLLSIAVSTGGASPLLARKIRKKLEKDFGQEYNTFLSFLALKRPGILARVKEPGRRKKIFEALTAEKFFRLFRQGRKKEISRQYRGILRKFGM